MVFSPDKAPQADDPLVFGCGQCIGCRIKRAQDWAIRLTHEATLHDKSCFITATFDNYHLAGRENPGSVETREVQLLVKRLRKRIEKDAKVSTRGTETAGTPRNGSTTIHSSGPGKIRYFAVGEYGEQTGRPHYHVLVFGWTPEDGTYYKRTKAGSDLYNSETLSEVWQHQGHINYGSVSYDSAAYCAGYITKKFSGARSRDHYTWKCPITGQTRSKNPEFATMSRRPGIGLHWIEKHYKDVYKNDYVVMKDKKRAPPRYYDLWMDRNHPEWFAEIRDKRRLEYNENPLITPERRLDMHLCRWIDHTKRLRDFDNGTDDIHHLRQQSQGIPEALLHAKCRYGYADVERDNLHSEGS